MNEGHTSLAAVGYDAYGSTTDHKNYQGLPMPTWDTLPLPQKTAWNVATDAIIAGVHAGLNVGQVNQAIKANELDTNLISDGYHTFGELYDHRIENFITVARLYFKSLTRDGEGQGMHTYYKTVWRSKKHSDGGLAFGGSWFVLGINHEAGKQMTYHLPIERWNECDFAEELEQAPEWDGHTSADVLKRLKTL